MYERIKTRLDSTRQKRKNFLTSCSHHTPQFWITTWFGSGLLIPGPGTWGTLGGLLVGIPLLNMTSPSLTLYVAFFLFVLGLWATHKIEKETALHDPSFIVIDEVVAILLVLCFTGTKPLFALTGFILFRLYDIWKPWPISWLDKNISGAWGVMVDDIAAAIYAILTLLVIGYGSLIFYDIGID